MGQFCQPVGCAPITVKDMGLRMIEYIIKDMMSVARYLPFSLLVGIPGRGAFGRRWKKKSRAEKGNRYLCFVVFYLFCRFDYDYVSVQGERQQKRKN